MSLTVIGVGNRDRGDDAIGPLVADAAAELGHEFGDAVTTLTIEGDLADLALRWPLDRHVIVVDAVVSGAPAGTVHVVDDPDRLGRQRGEPAPWSTHGIGLAEAIELARLLDRTPRCLTVIGIEGIRFDHGEPPVPAVAAAVDAALAEIRARLVAPDRR